MSSARLFDADANFSQRDDTHVNRHSQKGLMLLDARSTLPLVVPFCFALCSAACGEAAESPDVQFPAPFPSDGVTPGNSGQSPNGPNNTTSGSETTPGLGMSETPVSPNTPLTPPGAEGDPDAMPPGPMLPGEVVPEVPPEPLIDVQDTGVGTSNLFMTELSKPPSEVLNKLQTAVNRYFGIGTLDPATPVADGGNRLYYELPQDPSHAFIYAADSADIRSEGMSYGMFIAVQMDMQDQFDRLWRFARQFMQFPQNTNLTAWRYYFRWQGTVNTANPSNWTINFPAETSPAPDGEEYFAAALYLANRRWGSNGEINYRQEADNISSAMLRNTSAGNRSSIIHAQQNMVVFVPIGGAGNYTDPSYHLPAFYELFAEDGPAVDQARWRQVTQVSHDYLVRAAHPTTGLHSDYAEFSGTPREGNPGDLKNSFRLDAWRVPMNMAVDYAWYGEERMKTQTQKYQAFFGGNLGNGNVTNSRFNVDGTNGTGGGASGLTATLAAAGHASDDPNRNTFLQNLWDLPQPQGMFRYYQGSVYLLGLLATAGRFDHSWSAEARQ